MVKHSRPLGKALVQTWSKFAHTFAHVNLFCLLTIIEQMTNVAPGVGNIFETFMRYERECWGVMD